VGGDEQTASARTKGSKLQSRRRFMMCLLSEATTTSTPAACIADICVVSDKCRSHRERNPQLVSRALSMVQTTHMRADG
jgi:hypothetical protein